MNLRYLFSGNRDHITLMAILCLLCMNAYGDENMKVYSFNARPFKFGIRLPLKESRDFPLAPVIGNVDIENDKVYDSGSSITLLEKYWDYHDGLFQSNVGTLAGKVRLRRLPKSYRADIRNIDCLIDLIDSQLKESFSISNEEKIRAGLVGQVVKLPSEYAKTDINGINGVRYQLGGSYDFVAYVMPLSSEFYVQIQFSFIDNSHGGKTDWRLVAGKNADLYAATFFIDQQNM